MMMASSVGRPNCVPSGARFWIASMIKARVGVALDAMQAGDVAVVEVDDLLPSTLQMCGPLP